MPLDPYLAERLHLLAGITFADLADPDAQSRFGAFMRDPAQWVHPDVTVANREIAGPHGPVPVRTYTPPRPGSAAVLWAHGGGFLGGDLDMPEAHVVAAELAARTGAVVVCVDYRLAVGGVRHPVPVDDVCAAWRWLRTELAADADAVALGGASAGAALALATALRDREEGRRPADLLLLAYPFAHFPVPALDSTMAAEMAALPRRCGSPRRTSSSWWRTMSAGSPTSHATHCRARPRCTASRPFTCWSPSTTTSGRRRSSWRGS